jgi:hypothetical protein
MKKALLSLFLLLIPIYSIACDCMTTSPILEFLDSEYVFTGDVIKKAYSDDLKNYTVTILIDKHYKGRVSKPKQLEFTFRSKYNKVSSSCDFYINENDKLLVYAKLSTNNILSFGLMCSNSKKLNNSKISVEELNILKSGNSFRLEDYLFTNELGFDDSLPIANLDLLFSNAPKTKYSKTYATFKMLIDAEGSLIDVYYDYGFQIKFDPLFKLPISIDKADAKEVSNFESDAISILRKIKTWEPKTHIKTNTNVKHIKHISLTYDEKNSKWNYEF